MSLLNEVLRDLQIRGAYDLEPLDGLGPVAVHETNRGWRTYRLPALAGLSVVAVVLLWRPLIDGQRLPSITGPTSEAVVQPQSAVPDAPDTLPHPEAANAVSGKGSAGVITLAPDQSTGHATIGIRAVDAPAVVAATPVVDVASVVETPAVEDAAVVEDAPAVVRDVIAADAVTVMDTPAQVAPAASAEKTTILRSEPLDAATRASTAVARGLTAMRGNDLPAAERLFREALAIDSGDGAVWGYLYSVQVRRSHAAAAEQTLRQGLIAAIEPAPLAKFYARMLLNRGEKDAAVGILQVHRPATASDTEYDAFLAALLQQLGRYAEAGEIYRTLLTVDESSGSWWIGLGVSHDSLGNRPDALSAFERAQRAGTLNPTLAKYARRRILELNTYE